MNVIYEALSGSHAYGLNHPYSDRDIRGIFVPSKKELLGFGYKETREQEPDRGFWEQFLVRWHQYYLERGQ